MRVALAQINPTIGAFAANAAKIADFHARAAERGAAVVLFPEMCLCGYPPGDLVEWSDFVGECEEALHELAARMKGGPAAVVGFVESSPHATGFGRSNSVAWIVDGRVCVVARKSLLPNYDVFDERRWFDPADSRTVVDLGGRRLGLSICEDLWNDERFWPRRLYPIDPNSELRAKGATAILNASASPFEIGKPALRRAMITAVARHQRLPVAYCNLVGGNDSLVFDGHSMVVDGDGRLIAHAGGFEEEILVADLPDVAPQIVAAATQVVVRAPVDDDQAQVLAALVLGVRDYAWKTGFTQALLGLSGGIDSALTAVIAARALGPQNVLAVALPSRFTAAMSDDDAAALARHLGIGFERVPIEPVVDAFRAALEPLLQNGGKGLADENLQARVRGTALMAIANQRGHLLLTTGNKSELGVGYCTLYGDMNGGLAVIGDVDKTLVFGLARHVNRGGEVIPWRTIERPPTAELREGQKDEDSLPPYAVLDRVLHDLVVERRGVVEQGLRGGGEPLAREVRRLLFKSEFKRKQAAPVLKVTPKAFGAGWRHPIAHRFGQEKPPPR
ncbi:MAG: NAD+ synthase [Planctomycetes bacterium]|nr:NAD+ synthase [Planctomycetota bacterium]